MINPTVHVGADSSLSPVGLRLDQACKHGLIVGATGSGKTVTVQSLAEGFAIAGVPVLVTDAKGDLNGLATLPDSPNSALDPQRQATGSLRRVNTPLPVSLWDLFGENGMDFGVPLDTFGAERLTRVLDLSTAQSATLAIVFEIASETGLELRSFEDVTNILRWCLTRHDALSTRFGYLSPLSIGTLLRQVNARSKDIGSAMFAGKPHLFDTLTKRDASGRGRINIISAQSLSDHRLYYGMLCEWMLRHIFDTLPERGNVTKPELVVIIDEAHLLFDGLTPSLLAELERVVRLIRSRGVGIYLATQNPSDVPQMILNQMGNRIIHALRGFTPTEQRKLKVMSDTFTSADKEREKLDFAALPSGTAICSLLGATGTQGVATVTRIRPPCTYLGALPAAMLNTHWTQQPRPEQTELTIPAQDEATVLAMLDRAFSIGRGPKVAGIVPKGLISTKSTWHETLYVFGKRLGTSLAQRMPKT